MDNVFRIKKSRDIRAKKSDTVSGTLDSIHQSVVSTIKEETTNVEEMEKKLEENTKELVRLDTSTTLDDILKATKLREETRSLSERLDNENQLEDYYLKNADIILKYYGTGEKVQSTTCLPSDSNTFVKYLAQSSATAAPSKKKLYDEYISRMKLNTGEAVDVKQAVVEHCDRCNISREEVSEEGILVCPNCGSEEYMLVVSDFPSFRDPPKERNNYAYKKINHLNEILNQFQAKESTIIPNEVMNEVVLEIKKRRIQNVAELTEKDMREILKKLNRSKYYEHATHIISRLNGNPPPTITPEIEEKIRAMFQEIQAPFLIYCPDDRTNFLSYSYILYKFFELLELDEYKVYFPLLKSRDRLIAHDQIWAKICDYLKWEFIRSV
jgi:predicted  nucleic acid-binding Zn-ribbon protein